MAEQTRKRSAKARARGGLVGEAARFRGTRSAHRDETGEDYVEAIGEITRSGRSARVRDLAAMMGVSHVTVVRTLGRLARRGLVERAGARSEGVRLTASGARLAAKSLARHEAVLAFLLAIGVPRAQAEIDAEGIEHHVSEATIRAFRRVALGAGSGGRAGRRGRGTRQTRGPRRSRGK